MKKAWIVFVTGLLLMFGGFQVEQIYAESTEEDLLVEEFLDEDGIKEMQQMLEEQLPNTSFSMSEYIKQLIFGEQPFSITDLGNTIKEAVMEEITANTNLWKQCFFIALIAAFFSNFAMMFQNKQVGETGYYIGVLLLFSLLITAFVGVFSVAEKMLTMLVTFMKVLLPVYFMLTAASSGQSVASGGYQLALLVVTLVDYMIKAVLLPAVKIYFFTVLINQLSKTDKFSKFLELLDTGIRWTMKGLLGLVTGLNVVQGLLLPGVQKVKQNAFLKTGASIPVVGDLFTGVTETVLSVLSLLRNAVGVAGVVAMLLLCFIPLIKLVVYALVFRAEAALLQPMGGGQICECMTGVSKTAGFLLYLEFVSMLLFGITILILSFSLGG